MRKHEVDDDMDDEGGLIHGSSARAVGLLEALGGEFGGLGWLDNTACWDADASMFFVEAGQAIKPEALKMCQGCPVRRECLRHVYLNRVGSGYFAGTSPGQRRKMSLDEALVYIQHDTDRE